MKTKQTATAKRTILVLGSNGFIGREFVKELLSNKREDDQFYFLNRTFPAQQIEGVHYFTGDFTHFDWTSLPSSPDIVIHFARNSSKRGRKWGRLLARFKGYFGNKRLLNYLSRQHKQCRVFYLSGSLMYGNHTEIVTEKTPLQPISFAKEYIYAEQPFLTNNLKNIDVTFVRVPWVLGFGSWFDAFYLKKIKTEQTVPIYGDGSNTMAFILNQDIAKCMVHLLDKPFQPVINLAYDYYISQAEFSQIIANKLHLPLTTIPIHTFERAIKEAFTSSIKLGSELDDCAFILEHPSAEEKIDAFFEKINNSSI
jgi:nucleoside-diphosphate-sugar epimerase